MSVALIIGTLTVLTAIYLWSRRRRPPLVIRAPRLGILNLQGEAAEPLIAADIRALTPVLGPAVRGSASSPFCDVLFIYCDIASDGRLGNFPGTLRDLIQRLQAPVVVVATENPGPAYASTTKVRKYGRANLVMTLSRNGQAFANFFVRLFTEMQRGVSMPVAWVKMAPQGPAREHENLPATIFACEAGQMVFA